MTKQVELEQNKTKKRVVVDEDERGEERRVGRAVGNFAREKREVMGRDWENEGLQRGKFGSNG